jgi:hypothetical protein
MPPSYGGNNLTTIEVRATGTQRSREDIVRLLADARNSASLTSRAFDQLKGESTKVARSVNDIASAQVAL